MLSIMRKHARSWLIKVLLGIIVVVFIFYFGVTHYQERNAKLASVNGDVITYDQYQQIYNRLMEQVHAQYRGTLSKEVLDSLNLKQRALDSLIEERLLTQEASRLQFTVTPKELEESIRSIPYFQVNGQFSRDRYLMILRSNRLEPAEFEADHSRGLLINKALDYITSNVVIGEREALDRFLFEREKLQIDYLTFEPGAHQKDVKVAETEVRDFFKKNIKKYEISTKVKVAYLLFRPEDFMDKIVIAPEEISDEYNANLEKFKLPKQVRARHILFKVSENVPAKVEEVRKKAEKVLNEAKEGRDFVKLAQMYSEDIGTAKKGGDLGFFARGGMVKPFEDAAFALKRGQISDLVRTSFGFHIIKVEEVREERDQPLEEVKDYIEKELKHMQARDLAATTAEKSYEEIMQGKTLKSVGERMMRYVESDYVAANQDIPGLEGEKEAVTTAFSLDKQEVAPVFEVGASGRYAILQLLDRKEAHDPELKDVEERVINDIKKGKAVEKYREEAQKFLDILKNWKDFPKEAQAKQFEVKETVPFTREEAVPSIGAAKNISQAAFTLTQEKPFYPQPVFYEGKFYVIHLKKRIPAIKEDFEKEKQSYTKELLAQKKQNVSRNWIQQIKNKAEIVMHQNI
jgi:peptidyl-prolyl cis-trans isomerase D